MRIDDDTQDQRLSLELTPLIDIIFILVLFFAVTTSFTKPEEVDDLRIELLNLNNIKQKLLEEIRQYRAQSDEQARLTQNLKDNYNTLNSDYTQMMVSTKEQWGQPGEGTEGDRLDPRFEEAGAQRHRDRAEGGLRPEDGAEIPRAWA